MSRKTQITTTELAKLAGKTAKTVQNWAKKGKIAYETDDSGKFLFDLSEIARSLPSVDISSVVSEVDGRSDANMREPSRKSGETDVVAVENKFLREKVDDLKTQVTDLKDEKERSTTEREGYLALIDKQHTQIAGLLNGPIEPAKAGKPSLISWVVFGVFVVVAIVAAITAQQSGFFTF